jgi:hypothetical protein
MSGIQTGNTKQAAIMRDLYDRLTKKLPTTYFFTQAMDQQGSQLLISQSSTPTAGQQNVAIRIESDVTAFLDVIGNPQKVYAPLKAQVIEESSTITGVSLLTLLNRLKIDLELARMGIKQERWLNANGTVPALSQFVSDGTISGSTLVASLPFDMYWPLSGQ